MNTLLTFDTHEFVKELKRVGFSEQQAEVLVKMQKAAIQSIREQIKHDTEMNKRTR